MTSLLAPLLRRISMRPSLMRLKSSFSHPPSLSHQRHLHLTYSSPRTLPRASFFLNPITTPSAEKNTKAWSSSSSSSSSPSSSSSSDDDDSMHTTALPDTQLEPPPDMDKYARQPIHRITLRQLLAIGSKPTPQKLIVAAQYLRDEVLVRLSRRVRDLGNLPFGLSNLAPIRQIRTLYIRAFIESTKVPAKVTEDNDLVMTAQLGHTLRRNLHNGVWLSHVLMQLKRDGKIVADDESETLLLQEFIDRFLNSRLGLRLLSAQHVAIHNPKPGFIGIVETNCVVADVCGQAIASASHVCNETYGHVPPVVLEGDVKATFRYVPEVLHQIVFELLKNSMRATLEHHDGTPVASMPPIRLVIARSKSGDVSINVADQGGGIPREDLPHVWSHLFSTAPMPNVPPKDMASDDADEAHGAELGGDVEDPDAIFDPVLSVPMAGYGYGLPIARIYARYFGGDLRIVPMVGYGTDAYVYLPAFERMMDKELEG